MLSKFHAWMVGWTSFLIVGVAGAFLVKGQTALVIAATAIVFVGGVTATWLALRARGPKYDTSMPIRPGLASREAAPLPPLERPILRAPEVPTGLAAAAVDVEALELEEPEVDLAVEEPPAPPAPAPPAGFVFRGFTLYERPGAKGPVRLFSKAKPVGGGIPIPLPEGAEAAWDAKKKRPYLAWPEPPQAPAAPEPSNVPPEPPALVPAPAPVVAPPHAARACAAMVDVGEFCEEAALDGSSYCKDHAKQPGGPGAEFEVVRDSAAGTKTALRLAPAKIDVVVPRGAPKPIKPLRLREAKLVVERDRRAAPTAKPLKRREVRLIVQRDRPQARSAKPIKARPTQLVVAVGREAPKPRKATKGRPTDVFADQEADKARARKALAIASPRGTLKVNAPNLVVAPKRTTSKPPRPLSVPTPDLVVLDTRDTTGPRPMRVAQPEIVIEPPAKTSKGPRPLKVVHAEIVAPKAKPLVGFKLKGQDDFDVVSPRGDLLAVQRKGKPGRCVAKDANGKRCEATARQGMGTCPTHADWRPTTDVVIERDTKARTSSQAPGRKR